MLLPSGSTCKHLHVVDNGDTLQVISRDACNAVSLIREYPGGNSYDVGTSQGEAGAVQCQYLMTYYQAAMRTSRVA